MTDDGDEAWPPPQPWHVTVHRDGSFPPREHAWHPREDVTTAVFVVVGVALLGSVVGLLWAVWAPHVSLTRLVGSERPFAWQFGIDAWFLLLAAVAGVFSGVAVYVFGGRGPGAVLGLVGGGVAAAAVAARVGFIAERAHTLSVMHARGVPLSFLDLLEFKLRVLAMAAAWPIAAVAVFAVIAAVRDGNS